jgi:hypothetical protein
MRSLRNPFRRRWAIHALLASLVLRAYVPVGFMPSAAGPFALELCQSGMQASAPRHGQAPHDAATHGDGAACPFGHAPVAGPLGQSLDFAATFDAYFEPLASDAPRFATPQVRAHQARGPPQLV